MPRRKVGNGRPPAAPQTLPELKRLLPRWTIRYEHNMGMISGRPDEGSLDDRPLGGVMVLASYKSAALAGFLAAAQETDRIMGGNDGNPQKKNTRRKAKAKKHKLLHLFK